MKKEGGIKFKKALDTFAKIVLFADVLQFLALFVIAIVSLFIKT